MACLPASDPIEPFDQLIPFTNATAAGLNVRTAGVGIRDFDTNITPASIALNLPAAPIDAYIYINTLQANGFLATSCQISVDGGGFVVVPLTLLAWCGNTCWLDDDDGSHGDHATTQQYIYNYVYWADVSSIVTSGSHTYDVKVIAISTNPNIATAASDTPHYPGCDGGQGIQIIATYNDGTGVLRHYRVWHGAKLLAPDGPNPIWPGGSPNYSVTFPSVAPYTYRPQVFAAVGDSQTEYPDTFCFNGVCAVPNVFGSVWQGAAGGMSNLLGNLSIGLTGEACANTSGNVATIDVSGDDGDCLCWFLFAYLAEDVTGQCSCDPGPSLPPGDLGNASAPYPPPFRDLTGGYDYVINGVGTRDIEIDTTPGTFSITVPGPVVEAYLYWNVIVDESVDADTANLNSTPYIGTMIGKVGNTCWGPPQEDGVNVCVDCGIRNQVWRADVTTQLQAAIPTGGLFNASVTIDNVGTPVEPICSQCSDTPHYPGCNGSQGVVLLVIYESPCGTKNLQVFDGAVLLTGAESQPTYGGTDDYSLDFNIEEEFAGCAKIALAIGDAQTLYPDTFSWNGVPLPLNGAGSYANPYVGNLMHISQHQVQAQAGINTIRGQTNFDCLCWFLFVIETYPLICDENSCGPNSCHAAAPFDQLYQYERMVGDIDFVLAGTGIRDIDTNATPAVINITIPGPVIKAYLYWNVIGGGEFCPDTAIFNDVSVPGDIIGCCGNTCWSAYCTADNDDHGDQTDNNNMLNKVWFQDVTALVTGSGSYTVSIPEVHLSGVIALAASDSPYYPGCCGGQGVALFVIYQTDPQVVTRPRQHCCVPVGSETVTERETREIILWHGAKLLKCDGCNPETIGGDPEYTVSWKTKYTWKPKIATAVGDAQSQYADSLRWNGMILPPQPSYFNPYAGNLLHVKTEYLPNHTAICDCGPNGVPNTVTAFTPDDCLCWFLFAWSGAIKCVTPIVSSAQSFISPPTPAMALWNPNPPDCCPLRLPCCGQACLPTRLKLGIQSYSGTCGCLTGQSFDLEWDKTQEKYILLNQVGTCGCTFFGWLYCVGESWTLYLSLANSSEISQVCFDGVNEAFPILCAPFGGTGSLVLAPTGECTCGDCPDEANTTLTITILPA